MSIIEAIILGFIQGFTEFLPISSSGVLIFSPYLFGWEQQPLDFDIVVHLGSLLAIIIAFRSDILSGWKNSTWLKQIAIGTIPVILAVLIIPNSFLYSLRTLPVIAFSLVFWGIVLWLSDIYQKKSKHSQDLSDMKWSKALFIGFSQVIALIPGSSRSGMTMSAGLLSGLNREDTARFSFLLAIPALIGAGLFTGIEAWQTGWQTATLPLLLGFIISFITSLLTIHFLLSIIKRIGYSFFAILRFIFAFIIILILI